MKRIIVTDHARFEMSRRGIREEMVLRVAAAPDQVVPALRGRVVHQSLVPESGAGRQRLLRVVLEEQGDALVAITAYVTSRIAKYWQSEAEP
jgi:hypothetical protein